MDPTDEAFDGVMKLVGNDGPFQRRFNYIFNFGLVIAAAMIYMNIVLVLNVPEHWCHVPGRENTNFTLEEWKNLTLPLVLDNRGVPKHSSCEMYKPPNIEDFYLKPNATDFPVVSCMYGHDYDKTYYDVTIVSEQNWVCERELYATNTFVLNRFGEVIGTFIFGQLGDMFGRRFIFYISISVMLLARIFSSFTSYYFIVFAICVFIASLPSNSIYQAPLVIAMEISKGEDRAHINMLQWFGWTLGLCIIPLVFWATGEWIWALIITSIPSAIFFLFPKYMIESPRWLATKHKFKEAAKQLQTIAEVNNVDIKVTETTVHDALPNSKVEKVYGVMSLFKGWRLATNTILITVITIVVSMAYFILILNASKMEGNPFLNFFWQCAVELPAYVVGRIFGDRVGRRLTTVLSTFCIFITSGLQMLMISYVANDMYELVLAMCIKFFVCIGFYSIVLQGMEVYPTCVRQTGVAFAIIVGTLCTTIGPYIVALGTNYDVRLPYVVMSMTALIASVCGLFVPETLHQKLPETLEDAQEFGKGQLKNFWSLPKVPVKETIEIVSSNYKQYSHFE